MQSEYNNLSETPQVQNSESWNTVTPPTPTRYPTDRISAWDIITPSPPQIAYTTETNSDLNIPPPTGTPMPSREGSPTENNSQTNETELGQEVINPNEIQLSPNAESIVQAISPLNVNATPFTISAKYKNGRDPTHSHSDEESWEDRVPCQKTKIRKITYENECVGNTESQAEKRKVQFYPSDMSKHMEKNRIPFTTREVTLNEIEEDNMSAGELRDALKILREQMTEIKSGIEKRNKPIQKFFDDQYHNRFKHKENPYVIKITKSMNVSERFDEEWIQRVRARNETEAETNINIKLFAQSKVQIEVEGLKEIDVKINLPQIVIVQQN